MSRSPPKVYDLAGPSPRKPFNPGGLPSGPGNISGDTPERFTDLNTLNQGLERIRLDRHLETGEDAAPTERRQHPSPTPSGGARPPLAAAVPEIIVSHLNEAEGDDNEMASISEQDEEDPHLLSPSNSLYPWSDLRPLARRVPSTSGRNRPRANSLPNVFYLPPLTSLPPSPSLCPPPPLSSSLSRLMIPSSPPPSGERNDDVDTLNMALQNGREDFQTPEGGNRHAHGRAGKVQGAREWNSGSRLTKRDGVASSGFSKSPRLTSTSSTSVYELFDEESRGDCTREDLLQRSKKMRKLVYSLGPDNFKTLYFEKLNTLKKSMPSKSTRQNGKKVEELSPIGSSDRSKRRVIFGDCPTRVDKGDRFSMSLSAEAQAAMEQEYAGEESDTMEAEFDEDIYDILPSIQ